MSLVAKFKKWYKGTLIIPSQSDIISPGYYKKPFVAKILGVIGRFWLANWKWIIGLIIAILIA